MFEVAKKIQQNVGAEAQAIVDYTELLECITEADIGGKDELIADIAEIIQDELDHEAKLKSIYERLVSEL